MIPVKLADLLAEARACLVEAGADDALLDARLLVEHFSGTTRLHSLSRPEMPVGPDKVAAVRAAVKRRSLGEPVHRIIGFREFYGLKLHLSADTLEPRPDTEVLVDAVLARLRQLAACENDIRVLDLGTGTGAIALAILAEIPRASAVGVDISADALATAERNARENGLAARFHTVASDWFEKISDLFHVIVSNPPYIETKEIETLQREVREHDPSRALDGGFDGLDAYRAIARNAGSRLARHGFIAVEIGHGQQAAVTALFRECGYRRLEATKDLAGRDRVLIFDRMLDSMSQKPLGNHGECS